MKKLFPIYFIGLMGLALGCTAQPAYSGEKPAKPVSTKKVDYFAENGFGNAVAIIQHPAGQHHEGFTYVSYQGPLEDPYVAAYNHTTKEWTGPFKAGVSAMGKDPNRKKKIDNHGKPSMIIDDLGYIHIFFGGHGGMPHHGENPLGESSLR